MKFLTTEEAAEVLSVHAETVRRWIREKKLPVYVVPGGRSQRILEDDLKTFLLYIPSSSNDQQKEIQDVAERLTELLESAEPNEENKLILRKLKQKLSKNHLS